MNQLFVFIANVKYPSSESYYLSANSYLVEKGNMEQLENAEKDFRSHIEVDGFRIVNMLVYIVPEEHTGMQREV